MDHTVYERKNTDLGSTSMTKSGGFSIKKRHRKLGALIGLAALAVPFAANLGTLGDAIHAVTGPQNVYESELLNVKLKTSQDKTKTTWDLEFDRSETSVSEQTVKFKLDLEKAGLKDAEIKQDDKTLDMREGIVSAVLKSQSTHLILTAISTNEDKHDITLPVTELGLYDEKNGENKLPVDNRSVDLTMAFEKVAEIAKESSSSETVTEAVAKESSSGKVVKEVQNKEVKVAPIVDGDNTDIPGFVQGEDPAVALRKSLNVMSAVESQDIQTVLIQRKVHTTPTSNGKTDPNNFQIWSNKQYQEHDVVTDGTSAQYGIDITKKFDLTTVAKIDGQYTQNATQNDFNNDGQMQKLRGQYHDQFDHTESTNLSSYNITFVDDNAMSGANFTVVYDRVGEYIDVNGEKHEIGATLSIGNLKPLNADHNRMGAMRFIEIPNNLYSGILYHGIESLDLSVTFYKLEGGAFTEIVNIDDPDKAQMTFASLNNFGSSGSSGAFQWENTTTGINYSQYAEMAAPISGISGTGEAVVNPELSNKTKMVKESSVQDTSLGQERYYSTGHGVYANDNGTFNNVSANNWKDELGSDTFENGGIGFHISGSAYAFRLYTGTGNTWQTITCATVKPLQLDAPRKTVASDIISGSTQASAGQYNAAVADEQKADANAAVQAAITQAREDFGTYQEWQAAGKGNDYDLYVAARETAVNKAITDTKVAYGDMFGKNLAIKPAETAPDGTIYFNYDYWIFQPTYEIGTDSIAKPDMLTMTDTLEPGVTLRNGAASDVIVYNTNGGQFINGTDFNVTISGTGTAENRQVVTVKFTDSGLAKMDFDGNDLAWNLNVHVSAENVLATEAEETWLNTANVKTAVNKTTGIDTNTVNVHLIPLGKEELVINKLDDLGNKVTGAEFTLEQTAKMTGWDGDEPKFGDDFDTPVVINPGSDSTDGRWVYGPLEAGKYTLTEKTVPGGYTQADKTIDFIVTIKRISDEKNEVQMYGVTDADKAALANLAYNAEIGGWSADIINPRIPVQFKLNKVDADGKALAGAKFEYALKSDVANYNADPEGVDSPWVPMTEGANGLHTIDSSVKLRFNETYVVRETSPSGYVMQDDFYFIVVPQNSYTSDAYNAFLTNLNGTNADQNAPINFLQVNAAGSYLKWLPANPEGSNPVTWVGNFEVANYAKSIFPRVGGTGIQAYIGAGLIVMLIAGGAAWYIKRRQNQ